MKCEEAEMRMAEQLAGEIGPADRPALEEHLLDCAACRGDFALARAGAAVAWPDTSAPRHLHVRFEEAPARVLRLLKWATGAAAALCMAILVLGGSKPPPGKPPAAVAGRVEFAAMIQDSSVGTLTAKDEQGRPAGELGLQSHIVAVEILNGVAKTTVKENFRNDTDRRLEGTFHFPLPSDASISRLALEVNGKLEEGTCLERERAREVFESIVRKSMDPALLEWMPGGMFKCRVFPIEPRSTKRVVVAYTQTLPFFRGRMRYVYPLASEKTRTHPPEEVRIDLRAKFDGKLAKIESPSHRLDVQRRGEGEAAMSFSARNYRPDNDFVVTMETEDEELRVVSHKTDGDDGYFALFLTPRGEPARKPGLYALLMDISASVSGPELEAARKVVRAMIERRVEGDRFEILAHNVEVERSGAVDLRAANDFMDRLRPLGGCDLLGALRAAPEEAEIVYIGEGTPTIGEADPAKILEAVKGRRVRTVAIGSDANVTLLEKMGVHARISPNENVARRAAEIAETLGGEVLSGLRVEGGEAVYDVVGAREIFYGERLVVTGRYRGAAARMAVSAGAWRREIEASFPVKEEGNNYIRRLWAQRKVADLLARGGAQAEVTALGVKHQIMTPWTSFLVLETEQMWKDYNLHRQVQARDEVLGARKGEGKFRSEGDGKALDRGGERLHQQTAKGEDSEKREAAASPVFAWESPTLSINPVRPPPPPPEPVRAEHGVPRLQDLPVLGQTFDRQTAGGLNAEWAHSTISPASGQSVVVTGAPVDLFSAGADSAAVGASDFYTLDVAGLYADNKAWQVNNWEDGGIEVDNLGRPFVSVPTDETDFARSGRKKVMKEKRAYLEDGERSLARALAGEGLGEQGRIQVRASLSATLVIAGGDEAIFDGAASGAVTVGDILAVTRKGEFVAFVVVMEAVDASYRARIWRELAVGKIRKGDRADAAGDLRTHIAGLPEALRLDLASKFSLDSIRRKVRANR